MENKNPECWIVKVEDWDGSMIISVSSTKAKALENAEEYLEKNGWKTGINITVEQFTIDASYIDGVKKSYVMCSGSKDSDNHDRRISIMTTLGSTGSI